MYMFGGRIPPRCVICWLLDACLLHKCLRLSNQAFKLLLVNSSLSANALYLCFCLHRAHRKWIQARLLWLLPR